MPGPKKRAAIKTKQQTNKLMTILALRFIIL
jgi:hypothetical protein